MSDGGVILLKSLDEGIKLTEKVSAHFEDQRDDGRARHQYLDLFRQRVYGIALGYADCNDAARTRSDPCLKMACDRSPLDSDDDLGSQPMLSRFENSQDGRATVRLQREPESHVIRRLAKRRKKAKLVTIDLDPSCDPAHGQQQGTSFHGFYDTCCYLP
ncbi:MAG: transposase, partial [Planctomycetota bacterium]